MLFHDARTFLVRIFHEVICRDDPDEPSPPASIQNGIEALELSTKAIEKLRIIDMIHTVLSYSKWAKPLGYSHRGPCHDFLKKMENMGLIVITKAPGGVGVSIRLTTKAKRLIAASF